MGLIQFAKPHVWNQESRLCFAPESASQIFLRGMQKYAPHPPLPPQTCPFGRIYGQTGRIPEKRSERNKTAMRFIFAVMGKGAHGAENFHFPPKFYFRAQSERTYSPRSRPVGVMGRANYAGFASSAPRLSGRSHPREAKKARCFFRIACTAFRCSGSVRRLGICPKIFFQVSCIMAAAMSSWA